MFRTVKTEWLCRCRSNCPIIWRAKGLGGLHLGKKINDKIHGPRPTGSRSIAFSQPFRKGIRPNKTYLKAKGATNFL